MVWVTLAIAVLLGAGLLAWLWTIPLPARLAIAPTPFSVPIGSVLALNGQRFGCVLSCTATEIVVQPRHPLLRRR